MVVWKSGMDGLIIYGPDRRLINHSELKIALKSLQFAGKIAPKSLKITQNRSISLDFAQNRFKLGSKFDIRDQTRLKFGHRQVISGVWWW